MSNTLKLGNGKWATGKDTILAYNDLNSNYKPLAFSFSRDSSATVINKEGLIETVGSGEPRIDYKDDSKGALLLEPSRSNSLLQSNQFDTSWVTANTTVLGGQSGIYGNSDAWKLSENTVNSVHILLQNTTSVSNYTFSIYLKKGTKNKVMLFDGTNNDGVKFNLETQSVHSYYNNTIDYKIEILSDGWARYSISPSNTSSSFRVYMLDDNYNLGYEGNIENYIYIQNAQLEQGSYATSYIPTQGSAVTRVADVCNNGANEQVINSTEGVLYIEADILKTSGTAFLASISNGLSLSESINIRQQSSGVLSFQLSSGGSNTFINTTDWSEGINKIALRYNSNGINVYINGNSKGTNSATNYPNMNNLDLASRPDQVGQLIELIKVKDLRVYNTALTDAELISLTTI